MNVLISVGDREVMIAGTPFSVSVCAVPQFRFVPVMVTSVPTGSVKGPMAVMVGAGHCTVIVMILSSVSLPFY